MRIIEDNKATRYIFVPVEPIEHEVMASAVRIAQSGDVLHYGGRSQGASWKEHALTFHVGATEREVRKERGSATILSTEFVGGVTLVVRGSTPEDAERLLNIRNFCFYSRGPVHLELITYEGETCIALSGARCERCGGNMIDAVSCEWKTCAACAATCEHRYIYGPVHGGSHGVGAGYFCGKCGRMEPGTSVNPIAIHRWVDDVIAC